MVPRSEYDLKLLLRCVIRASSSTTKMVGGLTMETGRSACDGNAEDECCTCDTGGDIGLAWPNKGRFLLIERWRLESFVMNYF